jgi:hypothetical protein
MHKNPIFLAYLAGAVAMRDAAAKAALGDNERLNKLGHPETATAFDYAAGRIRAIDANALVAELLEVPAATPAETVAFEQAANAAMLNTTRLDNGDFLHPVTQRTWTVWGAAVRWAYASTPVESSTAAIAAMDRAGEVSANKAADGKRDGLYPAYVAPKRRADDAEGAQ